MAETRHIAVGTIAHKIIQGGCAMDAASPVDLHAFDTDGLSRREALLRIGASGLAVALAIQKAEAVYAQDATPPAAELPEGVGIVSLSAFPVRDLPTEPFTIQVARLTLEPGAATPISSSPYPSAAYVEEGTGLICPPAGEGRFITDADGKLVNSGADEMAYPLGTWCYTAPDTMDGVRNDGTEPASLLLIDLVPTTA
jgi:hypothetical protein